jgi:plastocyanin
MNSTKWIVGFIVIIIIAIAAFMLLGNQTATAPTETPNDQQASVSGDSNTIPAGDGATADEAQPVTVHLTASGFSPATVTVKAGDSVTFVNDTDGQMWVASAQHPTHTAYDGNNLSTHCAADYTGEAPFDECESVNKGGTYTFTFDKTGTWKYHNHANASTFGTVVVE